MSIQIECGSNQLSNGHTNNTLQCQSLNCDFHVMRDDAANEFSNADKSTLYCEKYLNDLDKEIDQLGGWLLSRIYDHQPNQSCSNDGAHNEADDESKASEFSNAGNNPRKRSRSNDNVLQLLFTDFDSFAELESFDGDEEIESTGGLFGYDGTFCPSLNHSRSNDDESDLDSDTDL